MFGYLEKLKDKSFDHCITDPPYNILGMTIKELGGINQTKIGKILKSLIRFLKNGTHSTIRIF